MFLNYFRLFAKILFKFLLLLTFFFASCSLDDSNMPEEALIKYINYNIDTLTYWNRAVVYIINKPDFQVNDTLIIQAGTVIKFNPDSGRSITISDTGYISAQGSSDKPVVFTSLFDSKHGRLKGKSTKAAKGDWDNIIINSRKNSLFYMCHFYYGGGGENKSTLALTNRISAVIKACVFVNNDGGDLINGNGVIDAQHADKKVLIRNNIFYNNNLPISISTSLNIDSTGIYHNPDDTSVINKYNAIKVVTELPMRDSIEWTENEVPFVITGPRFEMTPSTSLLLGNYVVLKFLKGSTMLITGKNTVLRNNEGRGVAFTSVNDDLLKGDTNGDGNNSIAAAGDWSIHVANKDDFEWDNVFYATRY